MTINDKFYMAGTERTGRYLVVLVTALGRVGYRDLGGGTFRVRIEPASREAGDSLRPHFPGYKAGIGGAEYRFSTMVSGGESALKPVIENAVKALVPGGEREVNPAAPQWAQELVSAASLNQVRQLKNTILSEVEEHASLLAEARKLGIRGANSRWTVETLRRKIAEAKPTERAFGALPPEHVQKAMDAKGGPLTAAELSQLKPAETEDEERERLVAEVRARKLPGANFAARWSLAVLRAKLAQ